MFCSNGARVNGAGGMVNGKGDGGGWIMEWLSLGMSVGGLGLGSWKIIEFCYEILLNPIT